MNINERNIKIWSTIGARATLGIAALELAKEIDNLMVLTCDVSTSAGLDRFRKTYPGIDLRIPTSSIQQCVYPKVPRAKPLAIPTIHILCPMYPKFTLICSQHRIV